MADPIGGAWRRFQTLLHWRRHRDELAEEIAVHQDMRRAHFEALGMTREHAEAAAHRAMGNVTTAREESRGVWIVSWIAGI